MSYNVENMESKEEFKFQLSTRNGLFFKFYEGNFLRIGVHNKYLIEGIGTLVDTVHTKTFPRNEDLEILLIDIIPKFIEGEIIFDATISNVDNQPNRKICFFLPNGHDKISMDIVRKHEINHLRTIDLIKVESGNLNSFYSEILADTLLIKELKSEELIKVKLVDVRKILSNKNIPQYYKKYLELIENILISDNPKQVSEEILSHAIEYGFEALTVEELIIEINDIIKNYR